MSQNYLRTSCIVAILGFGIGIGSQRALRDQLTAKDSVPVNTKQLPKLKMGVINITQVLKEFEKANADGGAISQLRRQFVDLVRPMKERLAQLTKDVDKAKTEEEKARLRENMTELNRQIEDVDQLAMKELCERSDQVMVKVYQEIQEILTEVGKERGADIITAYPDASDDTDPIKPELAQLKLQTPAMTPFYVNPDLDLTKEVIVRLNKKYPLGNKKKDD